MGIALIFGLLQSIVSIFQLIELKYRTVAKKSVPHVLFSVLFCLFNFTFEIKDNYIPIGLIIGTCIASFYFYLIFNSITPNNKGKFRIGILLSGFAITLTSILLFNLGSYMDNSLSLVLIPLIMTFYFFTGTALTLYSTWTEQVLVKKMFYRGVMALFFLCSISVSFYLENSKTSVLLATNVFFFVYIYEYWKKESKLKTGQLIDLHKKTTKERQIELINYNLTKLEMEVALHLISGKSPQDIADEMEKNKETIYKHSSNIYRKTNTVDRTDLILKFGNEKIQK